MSEPLAGAGPLCCPTCRAPFRQAALCPRCGTDLLPLMAIAAAAVRRRNAARSALAAQDAHAALLHAEAALSLHATEASRQLAALARLLARAGEGRS